ncbi:hypothetical protein BGAL_0541g00030 [Botrytis galanthina]|uniref:Uncharacterized protein n=1 Tax=Botrytis galanthina TaxID=278940 RepID=A0A4S8QPC3_9HELO|nr:hypothetical protein BGAL_0541g00030 [Botrytis galanthina]
MNRAYVSRNGGGQQVPMLPLRFDEYLSQFNPRNRTDERERGHGRPQQRSFRRETSIPPPASSNIRRAQERERDRTARRYGDSLEKTGEEEVDQDTSDEEIPTYSFSLSRHEKINVLGKSSSQIDNSIGVAPAPDKPKKWIPYDVSNSRYTGDLNTGGTRSAKLTYSSTGVDSVREPPLSSWIHVAGNIMSVEKFQGAISDFRGLGKSDINSVSKFLERLKERYEKPFQASSGARVRHMVPKSIKESLGSGAPSENAKIKDVKWLCMPYFSLQASSEVTKSSNVPPSAHFSKALMHSSFTNANNDRNSKQAVCHLPDTPAGHYFCINQAWFLTIDNSFLISSSEASLSELHRNKISIGSSQSNGQQSHQLLSSALLVSSSYGSSTFSIPLDECKNWFDFQRHFLDKWPTEYEFKYNDVVITAGIWPEIHKLAKKTLIHVEFYVYDRSFQKLQPEILVASDVLDIRLTNATQTTEAHKTDPKEKTSHYSDLSLLGDRKDEEVSKPSESSLNHEMSISKADICHQVNILTWHGTHKEMPGKHPKTTKHNIPVSWIENTALQADLLEIDKFLVQKTNLNDRMAYQAVEPCTRQNFYDILTEDRSELATSDANFRRNYILKVNLANAAEVLFRFFLPFDCHGPTVERYWGALYPILLVPQRRYKIDYKSARNRSSRPNISETYSEYMRNLNDNFEKNRLDRGHQERIIFLKQEISVILDTLRTQQEVLEGARQYRVEHGQESGENLEVINTNKDRQENAIYIFTIVTIIFLPLSTVASILGMNTNDVRNMEFTQWIFWAVALPLTVIIIALCLTWTGDLRKVWDSFSNLWRRARLHRGSSQFPEESVMSESIDNV